MNRSEITEQQITELMQAIPKADEVDALRAEVARLRADAERFRWLAVQKRLHLYTDGGTWTRADGTTFRAWGVLAANGVGYPPAETLAELVDLARKDQEDGR